MPIKINNKETDIPALESFFQFIGNWIYKSVGWHGDAWRAIGNAKDDNAVEAFVKDAEDKAHKIPKKHLIRPNIRLLFQYLDSAKFCISEEELRRDFSKLVVNTMDDRMTSYMHPAFGEILKQMSPLDARLFKALTNSPKYLILVTSDDKYFLFPSSSDWFDADYISINNSLRNLSRLELISFPEVTAVTAAVGGDFDMDLLPNLSKALEEIGLDSGNASKHPMEVTAFGLNFFKACS